MKKWFDLIEISAIRGMIHVSRGDYSLHGAFISQNADEAHGITNTSTSIGFTSIRHNCTTIASCRSLFLILPSHSLI